MGVKSRLPGDPETPKRLLRVLCLHGSRQTKEIFKGRLGKFPKKCRQVAEFVFMDAPHVLPLRAGDDVATRTWWLLNGEEKEKRLSIADSVKSVCKFWKENGPFDGLFGFSMGGTMACALAARHLGDKDTLPGLRFVMAGGAPSFSGSVDLWGSLNFSCDTIHIPSFHVIGKSDKVVSAADSFVLAKAFEKSRIYEHEDGHCLPMRKAATDEYVDFINSMSDLINEDEFLKSEKLPSKALTDDILCSSEESMQSQADDIDALCSIFPDITRVVTQAPERVGDKCGALAVDIATPTDSSLRGGIITVIIKFPSDYPNLAPNVEISHQFDMLSFPAAMESKLLAYIKEQMSNVAGMPVAYTIVLSVQDWLEVSENLLISKDLGDSIDMEKNASVLEKELDVVTEWESLDEDTESKLIEDATKEACEFVAAQYDSKGKSQSDSFAIGRGVKTFTVGLVGKPSAGKSSFFNAITKLQDKAKVAEHPFTTIDPNVGRGWWTSDDMDDIGFSSRFGRDAKGRRFLPVIVKDVAGLVPGAYKNFGKGNRFLNDLCDADALIHVVDVSESSDRNGNAVIEGDDRASSVEADVKWVREELHRWISGNVLAKWNSILRAGRVSPSAAENRLLELFTGYQGPVKGSIELAASRASLSLSEVALWSLSDIHRLVAHFLSVRFPMCLALNKADKMICKGTHALSERLENAKRTGGQLGYAVTPCSAKIETVLLLLAQRKAIDYTIASSTFDVLDRTQLIAAFKGSSDNADRELDLASRLLSSLGGSGVSECISTAVRLCNPVLIYPVSNLSSGDAICLPPKRNFGGVENRIGDSTPFPMFFPDCLQAIRGATVEDVYLALKRNAVKEFKLDGDFIRAEACALGNEKNISVRQCGKDWIIDSNTRVLKILTNRRPRWQHKINV